MARLIGATPDLALEEAAGLKFQASVATVPEPKGPRGAKLRDRLSVDIFSSKRSRFGRRGGACPRPHQRDGAPMLAREVSGQARSGGKSPAVIS